MPPVNPDLRVENRIDIVLVLLRAGAECGPEPEPVVGITRLMKLLFLLEKEASITQVLASGERYFDFQPYDMGPFDADVYDAIEFLEDVKLVKATPTGRSAAEDAVERSRLLADVDADALAQSEYTPPEAFRLTATGVDVARKLLETLPAEVRASLERVKRDYNPMPLRDLLRYVYRRYPDAASYSRIRAQLGLE